MADVASLAAAFAVLASLTITTTNTFDTIKQWLNPSERRDRLDRLDAKAEAVTESLRAMGELLAATREISEPDLKLAMQVYCSAFAQITLLDHDLASLTPRRSIGKARVIELDAEMESINNAIASLRHILTTYARSPCVFWSIC